MRTVAVAVVQMDAGPQLNRALVQQVRRTQPVWAPVASPVPEHLPRDESATLYMKAARAGGVQIGGWQDQEIIYDSPTMQVDVPGWWELAGASGKVLVLWGLWARGSALNDVAALEDCARHGQLLAAWADLIAS